MTHLLGAQGLDVLAGLARSATLVAFDFDGTLAPIVADREAAAMRPRTRQLLSRVFARYPSAVISGRKLGDIAGRLDGVGVSHVVGNHGLEPGRSLETFEFVTQKALRGLSAELAGRDDLDIEHKRYTLTVHYRRARHPDEAERTILAAVGRLPIQMRIVPGKFVVNVLPPGASNKGDALLRLKAAESCDTALYVGDDDTDEDVFRLDPCRGIVSVRVGESPTSAARWFLRDQLEVDGLLETLASLRDGTER